jgi:hypothetical protein
MVYRKASGNKAAAGTTYDHGRFQLDLIQERVQIGREITDTVTPCGAARITVAPLSEGKGVDIIRQVS